MWAKLADIQEGYHDLYLPGEKRPKPAPLCTITIHCDAVDTMGRGKPVYVERAPRGAMVPFDSIVSPIQPKFQHMAGLYTVTKEFFTKSGLRLT